MLFLFIYFVYFWAGLGYDCFGFLIYYVGVVGVRRRYRPSLGSGGMTYVTHDLLLLVSISSTFCCPRVL